MLRMTQWLHFVDIEIFGNIVKPTRWIVWLSVIGYSYLIFPFVTLILWIVLLI